MTPDAFVKKWSGVALTERSAAQQHFLDLCALTGHSSPAEADPAGEWFTFERGAEKSSGGDGFADVWKRGFFAIEYKGRHKDLDKAYQQILLYREALENPPLLAVCDLDRIVIHTNFTATAKKVHEIALTELPEPRNLEILRNLFHAPDKLRPGATSQAITEQAAARLGSLALSLRGRGLDPAEVARFVDRVVFCLFAEDVALLPADLFTNLFAKTHADPPRLKKLLDQLFHAMAHGGDFGLDSIRHFNGDLFNDAPAVEMLPAEIEAVLLASKLDWSAIDPSIFGTLFERGLDPAKRSQLGAHYTSREDIELLIEPVVMAPLRAEWAALQRTIENLLATGTKAGKADVKKLDAPKLRKAIGEANMIKERFLERLGHVTVLDPACGSGNFLYVTLQKLKDLEKEIALYGSER
ncbi:MAG: type IIL restriction-modification enzyme MmeI, partial [Terrimicrobiaceae bacterium]